MSSTDTTKRKRILRTKKYDISRKTRPSSLQSQRPAVLSKRRGVHQVQAPEIPPPVEDQEVIEEPSCPIAPITETTPAETEQAPIPEAQKAANPSIKTRIRARVTEVKSTSIRIFTNTWFIISVCTVGVQVASVLLLLYGFVFLKSYEAYGSVLSLYPWSWNIVYSSINSVAYLFSLSFVFSLAFLIVSTAVLYSQFIPRFRTTFIQSLAATRQN